MSESRQMSDSRNMEKDVENRDEICISPAFSVISETSELLDVPDSLLLDETLAYLDLMNCDDLFEEGPGSRPLSPMSRSWCSVSDSDVSEIVTSFDQNVDEEITKVCQSFLYLEDPEKEADESGDGPWTSQTRSTSRLAIKSEESTRPASSDSIDITKTAKMLISQSSQPGETLKDTEPVKTLKDTEPVKTLEDTEPVKTLKDTEPVKTLEDTEPVKTLEDTEPVKTLEDTELVKTPEDTELVKTLKDTEPVETPKDTEPVKTLEDTEPVETLEDTESVKMLEDTEPVETLEDTEPVKMLEDTEPVETLKDTEPVKTFKDTEPVKTLDARPLQLVEEEIIRTVVPSSASTSSLPPAHQVDHDNAETMRGGCKDKKKSLWKRCFKRWQRAKPAPHCQETSSTISYSAALGANLTSTLRHQSIHSDKEDDETSSQSSVDQSQPDSESNNQADVEETKAKKSSCFSRFFCNVFSKNEKKEKKKASAEYLTEPPTFWTKLLCCSPCSCCLDM